MYLGRVDGQWVNLKESRRATRANRFRRYKVLRPQVGLRITGTLENFVLFPQQDGRTGIRELDAHTYATYTPISKRFKLIIF